MMALADEGGPIPLVPLPRGSNGASVAGYPSAGRRGWNGRRCCCASRDVGGKSGLHRAGWPLTAAPSDRGKVPQRTDRPHRLYGEAGKGETAR